ncbi:MAG: lipocalin family protein [Gammaproteobacteria bacterium]|nr:lipocalin family protein [Gammaproteobacteria bacterium]
MSSQRVLNFTVTWRHRLLFTVLFVLAGLAVAGNEKTLETVYQVDLGRYSGTWYEIARIPNQFQKHCVSNVSAEYIVSGDGGVEVINRCLDGKGKVDEARVVARIVDTESNARLEVSFVSLYGWQIFWGDYWILDLGESYEYSVVGEPGRKYAWILSRETSLEPEVFSHIEHLLTENGYDVAKLEMTRH